MKGISKEQIKNIIIAVLVIALGAVCYYFIYGSPLNLSGEQAAQRAIAYINNDLLNGRATATLNGKVVQQSGLYKINIKIGSDEFPSYVSKDGKLLFAQPPLEIKTSTSSTSTSPNKAQNNTEKPKDAAQACSSLNPSKSASPQLEAFVVSECPYGLQMQRVLAAIVQGAPQLAQNIQIKYIGEVQDGKITSMHGEEEAQENLRQICIREEQKDKYFPYISCFIQEGKSQECLKTAGVQEAALNNCMKGKGIQYAQKDFEASRKYNATGSPTLILNGKLVDEFNFGGRSAQAVKEVICCGFDSKPSVCATELSTQQANVSFSKTYSGGASGGSSCQ